MGRPRLHRDRLCASVDPALLHGVKALAAIHGLTLQRAVEIGLESFIQTYDRKPWSPAANRALGDFLKACNR